MTPATIEVMFTCNACGLTKSKLSVRRRQEGEDLQAWMDEVMKQIQRAHWLRSLLCEEKKADVYLPVNPEGMVGTEPQRELAPEEKARLEEMIRGEGKPS